MRLLSECILSVLDVFYSKIQFIIKNSIIMHAHIHRVVANDIPAIVIGIATAMIPTPATTLYAVNIMKVRH